MTTYYWIILILAVSSLVASVANHFHRLSEVERKLNLVLQKLGIDPLATMAPSQAVMDLARDPAKKIAAIRQYRLESGANLKDALKVIESMKLND